MSPIESPQAMRRRIAYDLADMRDQLGWSQTYVAEQVSSTQQTVASIERRRTVPSEDMVRALLRLYGREQDTDEYLSMRKIARQREAQWKRADLTSEPLGFADFVGLEVGARSIEGYELRIVPGILQSRTYARHVISRGQRSTTGVDRKVDIRLRRQEILTRADNPVQLWMVIEERALAPGSAPPDVMREQYGHLLELAELDNVQLQVCPESAVPHPGMTTSFVVLNFASPRDPGLVAVETAIRTLFFEEEAEIEQYATIMDHLRTLAAPQEASAALIEQKRKEV